MARSSSGNGLAQLRFHGCSRGARPQSGSWSRQPRMRSSTTSGRSPMVGLVRSNPAASRNPEPRMYSSSAGMRARQRSHSLLGRRITVEEALDGGIGIHRVDHGCQLGRARCPTRETSRRTPRTSAPGPAPVHCMAWRMKSPTGSMAAALKRWCWNHIALEVFDAQRAGGSGVPRRRATADRRRRAARCFAMAAGFTSSSQRCRIPRQICCSNAAAASSDRRPISAPSCSGLFGPSGPGASNGTGWMYEKPLT